MVKGLYEKYAVRISNGLTKLRETDPINPLLNLASVDLQNNQLIYKFEGTQYDTNNMCMGDALLLYVCDLENQIRIKNRN